MTALASDLYPLDLFTVRGFAGIGEVGVERAMLGVEGGKGASRRTANWGLGVGDRGGAGGGSSLGGVGCLEKNSLSLTIENVFGRLSPTGVPSAGRKRAPGMD